MSFLRNMGPLFVRHYEKVIVALALIGFLGAVVYLYGVRQAEAEKINAYDRDFRTRKGKPVPSVDLAEFSGALNKAKNPPVLDFGLPHNLFNPVKWQKKPDGTILKIEKGTEVGAAAMKIAKVEPLRTLITIDRAASGGLYMSAVQEASTNRALWIKRQPQYLSTNQQHATKIFTLREIGGTLEKPEANIELASGDKLTVAADKPYEKVEGFKVDLQYPPENKNFPDQRVGSKLTLGGEDYIIVAITENEVVVSASSINRRTTIRK
jgi:hypothetical protein